ncbi:MAG: carbohydrate kinase family protein [Phycisphaeraceae bacterium]
MKAEYEDRMMTHPSPQVREGGRCVLVGTIVSDQCLQVDLDQIKPGATLMVDPQRSSLGGNAGRSAATLAALGIPVILLGDIGTDSRGDGLSNALSRIGVDTRGLHRHEHLSTSTTVSLVHTDGERVLLHDAGANIQTDASVLGRLSHPLGPQDILCVSGARLMPSLSVPGAVTLLQRALEAGAMTVYDTTVKPPGTQKEHLDHILAVAEIFCTSMGEARADWSTHDAEETAERLMPQARGWVVVKDGGHGAVAGHRKSGLWRCAAPKVDVRDTTGAGDNFMAGLIYGLCTGRLLPDALGLGVACGAASVAAEDDLYKCITPDQMTTAASRLTTTCITASAVARSI